MSSHLNSYFRLYVSLFFRRLFIHLLVCNTSFSSNFYCHITKWHQWKLLGMCEEWKKDILNLPQTSDILGKAKLSDLHHNIRQGEAELGTFSVSSPHQCLPNADVCNSTSRIYIHKVGMCLLILRIQLGNSMKLSYLSWNVPLQNIPLQTAPDPNRRFQRTN